MYNIKPNISLYGNRACKKNGYKPTLEKDERLGGHTYTTSCVDVRTGGCHGHATSNIQQQLALSHPEVFKNTVTVSIKYVQTSSTQLQLAVQCKSL